MNDGENMNINDKLALERTKLANWRTLLAYIRTGLSFIALGIAVFHFLKSALWAVLGIGSVLIGVLLIILGFISYKRFDRIITVVQGKDPGESE